MVSHHSVCAATPVFTPPTWMTRARLSTTFLLLLLLVLLSVGGHDGRLLSMAEAKAVYKPSAASLQATASAHRGAVSLAHLTFASSNRQSSDQSYWNDVVAKVIAAQPARFAAETPPKGGNVSSEVTSPARTDMLLWTGNAVFTDISDAGVELVQPRSPRDIAKEYATLSQDAHYQSFVTHHVRDENVVGVWDEHDMGLRHGADKQYAQAREVRDIYLHHILRDRPEIKAQLKQNEDGGLYHFTTIPAPRGSAMADVYKNAVCVIALDVVSLRDPYPDFDDSLLTPFPTTSRGYQQARKVKELPQADLLGERQWIWLESIVKKYVAPKAHATSTEGELLHDRIEKEECALTVFASAWQVLLNDNKPFTGWDLFPASRTRLLALLKNYEASRFLFVSGHAELAEIGGVVATSNGDIEQKRSTGVLGMYAKHFPLTPLTKYSRKLLPFVGAAKEGKANGGHVAGRDSSVNGLVEVTSSGLTHSISSAPFIGRAASWLVDGDTTSHTLTYNPDALVKLDREMTMEEGSKGVSGGTSFRFMSRYLLVGREVKARRNIGTIQLLTPLASAKAFMTSATVPQSRDEGAPETATEVEDGSSFVKDVRESDDPRLAGYGNGPAAAKAYVDDHIRVFVSVHATDDGSALITYDTSLAQLPTYHRTDRRLPNEHETGNEEANAGIATVKKGTAHFIDYKEIPPFSVFNVPGEYPSIKRSILGRGCAELPCVHGKYFMIGKMVFILATVFVVLAVFAAAIITVLLFLERRREREEEKKLKMD